ncbi:MAG: DinB family protein, partial [Ginsengibacter sp.]
TGNSIGSLLLHIASAEVGYQAATFYNRQLNEDEKHEWDTALALGEKARQEIKGHDLDYYLNKLEQVRAKTLAELANRDDQWLDEQTSFRDNRINNYFKWFHVFTHEVNHRGQINILRRQAKQNGGT